MSMKGDSETLQIQVIIIKHKYNAEIVQKTQIYVHENDDGLQITYRKMWEPPASSFNEAHLTHEATYTHTHTHTHTQNHYIVRYSAILWASHQGGSTTDWKENKGLPNNVDNIQ